MAVRLWVRLVVFLHLVSPLSLGLVLASPTSLIERQSSSELFNASDSPTTTSTESSSSKASESSSSSRSHSKSSKSSSSSSSSTTNSSADAASSTSTKDLILHNKVLDKEYGPLKLRGSWIIMIVLAVVLLFLLMCIGAWFVRRRYRARQAREAERKELEDIKEKQERQAKSGELEGSLGNDGEYDFIDAGEDLSPRDNGRKPFGVV